MGEGELVKFFMAAQARVFVGQYQSGTNEDEMNYTQFSIISGVEGHKGMTANGSSENTWVQQDSQLFMWKIKHGLNFEYFQDSSKK